MVKLKEMREKELKLFVIEFNKGAQLDRSLTKSNLTKEAKERFRKVLLSEIICLMDKVDNKSLKNADIIASIKKAKSVDRDISFGQAQKVINVALKQYCFITNQKETILKELDCPLDSTTMKGCKIKNNKMVSVLEEDYAKYQKLFAERHNGFKVLEDIKYDENRINGFIHGSQKGVSK